MPNTKIVLMGIGEQGRKAVREVRGNETFMIAPEDNEVCEVQKIYIDKASLCSASAENGKYLSIPFEYEMSAWVPEFPVRSALADRDNEAKMMQLVENAQLLVVAVGIGGGMSIVAKEILRFYRRHAPNLKLYLIGTIPFKQESEPAVTDITDKVLAYVSQERIACTIISNDEVYAYLKKKNGVPRRADNLVTYSSVCEALYREAHRRSGLCMSRVLEGMFGMLSPQFRVDDLCRQLGEGLVHYSEYELIPDQEAPVLRPCDRVPFPYELKAGSAVAEFCMQTSFREQPLYSLNQLDKLFHDNFGKETVCMYREVRFLPQDYRLVKVLGAGKGQAEHLYSRGIHVFSLKGGA